MFKRTSYQNGSLTKEPRAKGPAVWAFRWRERNSNGVRIKRKLLIGTVAEYRSEAHARRALAAMSINVNQEKGATLHPSLLTVGQLVDHYKEHELSAGRNSKAESTCDVYRTYIDTWIVPTWKEQRVTSVKTVAVEEWLRTLPLADASKSKVRNIFSALFNHGIRHELASSNPIIGTVRGSGVRQSAKRRKTPDVLTPEEIRQIVEHLRPRERLLVILAATTGLRISELRGLQWGDVNWLENKVIIVRGVVGPYISSLKTAASRRSVPCHPSVIAELLAYRKTAPFNQDGDWVFASEAAKGRVPVWPSSLLQDHIQPAVKAVAISKHVSFHTFRHSYATLLKSNGADAKVVQESLGHSSSRISMDVYTQAIPDHIRAAHGKVVESIALQL